MSFPEWGRSYNALHVPLTSDWQCSLVPAPDVEDVDRGWKLSYEERQTARKEREKQIEQDQRDFDRLFRVSIGRRAASANSDFQAYIAFIREHLRIAGLSAPLDGEGVTRTLRNAVRDGRLIPAINRDWRGTRRVSRPYGPQSWPKRMPDPKPTVHGVRNGELVPLDAEGRFIDRTPYVPVKVKGASIVSAAGGSGGRVYWPEALEEAAQSILRDGHSSETTDSDDVPGTLGLTGPTSLGDAQPFSYETDALSTETREYAARGVGMTGNEPGGFRINPNGADVDYFDSNGNLCAQYHASHGEPHGHNFFDGQRDSAHLPMSPINCK